MEKILAEKQEERRQIIERCIGDRERRILGYLAEYSDKELQHLLQKHASEGWHVSYAKYTENGLQQFYKDQGCPWFLFCQKSSILQVSDKCQRKGEK